MAKLVNVRNGMSKESAAALARHPSSFDTYKIRAYQYAFARHGIDLGHSSNLWRLYKAECVQEHVWIDGRRQNRIRAVFVEGTRYDIPNWDFVPQTVEETQIDALVAIGYERSTAEYELSTRPCIEHAYGMTTRLSFQINVF